jgi:hypothetical protein
MSLLRQCGTSKLLRQCGTSKLLRACPAPASTNPCDYDTILATVSGLTLDDCCLWELSGESGFALRNLVLDAMPVTLTRDKPGCAFGGRVGTVDWWSATIDGCVSYIFTRTVYLWVPPSNLGNSILIDLARGDGQWLWSDGGDWFIPCGYGGTGTPCFGTYNRYSGSCTNGGTVTLEAP